MDITWLETLSQLTDQDAKISEIISQQTLSIQQAYHKNDAIALRNQFGHMDNLPMKKTVFSLQP